jgi:CubicO group peptidase (beta-lactamase class C family)
MPRAFHIVLAVLGVIGASSAALASDAALRARLEEIRAAQGVPGLVAGCVTPAGVEVLEAVGVRRNGGTAPLLATDRMHLGSCTKAFTATLAAVLVADGVLRWDSTVGQVLGASEPGMDAGWRDVTLEALLRHRGGAPAAPNAADWRAAWECGGAPDACRAAFVRSMLGRPPGATRGSFAYSNQGYALAGRLCEVAAKEPYEALLVRRVLAPLGIKDAGFAAPVRTVPASPSGHRQDGTPDDTDNPASIAPAGTLHMPVGEWMKFVAFHIGAPPPPALEGAASQLAKLHATAGEGSTEALGWMVTTRPWGGRVLNHAGSNTLWFCVAWLSPERKFAVVAACNQGGPKATKACDDACAAIVLARAPRQDAPRREEPVSPR